MSNCEGLTKMSCWLIHPRNICWFCGMETCSSLICWMNLVFDICILLSAYTVHYFHLQIYWTYIFYNLAGTGFRLTIRTCSLHARFSGKHLFSVSPFPFPSHPNQPPWQPHPDPHLDPHPIVPFPFSFFSPFLPEIDGQTDLGLSVLVRLEILLCAFECILLTRASLSFLLGLVFCGFFCRLLCLIVSTSAVDYTCRIHTVIITTFTINHSFSFSL